MSLRQHHVLLRLPVPAAGSSQPLSWALAKWRQLKDRVSDLEHLTQNSPNWSGHRGAHCLSNLTLTQNRVGRTQKWHCASPLNKTGEKAQQSYGFKEFQIFPCVTDTQRAGRSGQRRGQREGEEDAQLTLPPPLAGVNQGQAGRRLSLTLSFLSLRKFR